MIDDYDVTDVDDGWLVLGANLESEARMAVFEDVVDRLTGSSEFVDEILALSEAEAIPGYWIVEELLTETDVIRRVQPGNDFGWLLRVED